MQVKLFAGDESHTFVATGFDKQGRETDIEVRADNQKQANDRISSSMTDYNWTDVQGIKQKMPNVA